MDPAAGGGRKVTARLGAIALCAGFALIAAPTLMRVATRSWTTEQGQFGVLTLALGAYFLVQNWLEDPAARRPASGRLFALLALPASATYVIGRIADEYLVEAYGLILCLLTLALALAGLRRVSRMGLGFALLFLSLPLPFFLSWRVSGMLRQAIAQAVMASANIIGMEVGREGLSLYVGSHQLDVEQACSGLNSLLSLSAISACYIELRRRPNARYYALLAVPIVLAAIGANYVRVLTLVLTTRIFGERVAQSALHEFAGFIMFAAAFGLVVVIDAAAVRLTPLRSAIRSPVAAQG